MLILFLDQTHRLMKVFTVVHVQILQVVGQVIIQLQNLVVDRVLLHHKIQVGNGIVVHNLQTIEQLNIQDHVRIRPVKIHNVHIVDQEVHQDHVNHIPVHHHENHIQDHVHDHIREVEVQVDHQNVLDQDQLLQINQALVENQENQFPDHDQDQYLDQDQKVQCRENHDRDQKVMHQEEVNQDLGVNQFRNQYQDHDQDRNLNRDLTQDLNHDLQQILKVAHDRVLEIVK